MMSRTHRAERGSGSSPSPHPPGRVVWVDAAKTIAITLIVVYHVSGAGAARLVEDQSWWVGAWSFLSRSLLPVRIPLFFLLAGFLAARSMSRSVRSTVRRRVLDLLWVFGVWSVAFSPVYGPLLRPDAPVDGIVASLASIPLGGNAYWFLFALPLFFLATRALIRYPVLALSMGAVSYLISASVAMRVADAGLDEAALTVRRITLFWFFYVAGAVATAAIDRIVGLPWWVALASAGMFCALTAWPPIVADPSARLLLLSLSGIVAALITSRMLASIPGGARFFASISRATLPIYLVHAFVLHSLYGLFAITGARLPSSTVLDALFVPVTTTALMAASIGFQRAVEALGIRGVFQLPWTAEGQGARGYRARTGGQRIGRLARGRPARER